MVGAAGGIVGEHAAAVQADSHEPCRTSETGETRPGHPREKEERFWLRYAGVLLRAGLQNLNPPHCTFPQVDQ